MKNIYIVEDDINILEIESYALESNGFSIKGFETAKDFYKALEKDIPSLVLLDIMLPDENGLLVLKQMRSSAKTEKLPIIMVTAKGSEIDIVKCLDSGADDYITKPFGVMELVSRVKALLRRTSENTQQDRLELEELVMEPDKRLCMADGHMVELTYKEYELLRYLMINAGLVMRRQILMDQIWGMDYEGGSRTLDAHIKSLRRKLGDSGRHIQTVRNVGYIAR